LSISRKRQLAAGHPPRYDGKCRALTPEERAERLVKGQPAALRFRVPQGQTVAFNDLVHGEQRFNSDDIGDFIIRRTDGSTAFFFSNAVDDALMGVTLVLRGDDHMTNTPRQILILQALALSVPQYAHVALLLGMDGAPLSKRHGDTSLRDLRERGYLPGAIRNHLVRLGHTCVSAGWLDDAGLLHDFDLNRLGRAAAKFDYAQLRHWQKEAVAHLSAEEFLKWIGPEIPEGIDPQKQALFVTSVRGNVELPSDAKVWAKVVFGKLEEFEPQALAAIKEAGEAFFGAALAVIGQPGADFKQAVKALGQATGKKGPALFMPLRAALTGFTHGPELAPMLALLSVEEVQARLTRARELAV
jgi:glutamyl-tRNA synthetase